MKNINFKNIKNMKNKIITLAVLTMLLTSCNNVQSSAVSEENEMQDTGIYDELLKNQIPSDKKNPYDVLNVATYINKADDTYFIVDCYHNQIIYNDTLTDELSEWNVLTDEVNYAHTIATDGVMLMTDDTENNRLIVFQKTQAGYVQTQILENIGMKPHFVQYNADRELFMAWSSITGELYLIKRYDTPDEQGIYPVYIEDILKVDELYGVYVRSFTVIGNEIYFVSGHNNQKIIKARLTEENEKTSLTVTAYYDVPAELAGMVQLYKIQDYYYITVSTDNTENQDYATIVRAKSLEDMSEGDYEDIYALFGLDAGTPYYINEIEGRYYMTHHRTWENIIAFNVVENEIRNVEVIY